uniref:Membrane protein insertase YidC n=1 Tax=candidate division CPR3 bacterium TaxID=2268181 RepID=A0A7C4M0F3_UNCC3
MGFIWNELLIKPMLNLMLFLYNVLPTHDLGLVIIVITIIIRLLVLPLSIRASRSQRKLKNLTPQLNELKEKYKGDQQALARAQMEFYKQNGVSPMGSCLPVLIQLPILIALYRVLTDMITKIDPAFVYPFIYLPETINHTFLGFLDLSRPEKYVMPILAGGLQYVLGVMTTPIDKSKNAVSSPESAITKQMLFMMPLMTVFLAISVPSGLTLYWIVTTVFSIGQQVWVNKEKRKEVTVRIKKAGETGEVFIAEKVEELSPNEKKDEENKENKTSGQF